MDARGMPTACQGVGSLMPKQTTQYSRRWKPRFAMTLAMAKPRKWNIDMSRFARENLSREETISSETIFESGSQTSNSYWRIAIWLRPTESTPARSSFREAWRC